MNEEIKVHPIKSFKDYGLAKRNFEELTKKISSLQLDLELDDEETPKLESGIVEMEHKLEEQKKHITEFINAQENYDSKFLSSNLDYLLKMHGLRILDAVIRVQGIVRLVVAGPLGIGGLGADAGPERLGHIIGNLNIFVLGVPVVKIAQVDNRHGMYLHIVFCGRVAGNDMEGGGERHPGEPPRTLGQLVPKSGKQKTLAPVRELVSLQRRCSNNLNQVAIHANTYGGIYPEEISALQRDYSALWGPLSDLLKQLSALVEL